MPGPLSGPVGPAQLVTSSPRGLVYLSLNRECSPAQPGTVENALEAAQGCRSSRPWSGWVCRRGWVPFLKGQRPLVGALLKL